MRSTFRNPTILICVVVLAIVNSTSGKSIIRELLDAQRFVADGRPASRTLENIPIENCRVTQNKDLSGKLDRLCDECFQTYRVANFYMQCRADCFDNDIFRGCAMAMFRQALVADFEKYIETEVAAKGKTVPPKIVDKIVDAADSKRMDRLVA